MLGEVVVLLLWGGALAAIGRGVVNEAAALKQRWSAERAQPIHDEAVVDTARRRRRIAIAIGAAITAAGIAVCVSAAPDPRYACGARADHDIEAWPWLAGMVALLAFDPLLNVVRAHKVLAALRAGRGTSSADRGWVVVANERGLVAWMQTRPGVLLRAIERVFPVARVRRR